MGSTLGLMDNTWKLGTSKRLPGIPRKPVVLGPRWPWWDQPWRSPKQAGRKAGPQMRGAESDVGEQWANSALRAWGRAWLCPGFGFSQAEAGTAGLGSIWGEALRALPVLCSTDVTGVTAAHSRGIGVWSVFGLGSILKETLPPCW